jgi:hypothetical protein
MRQVRGDRGGSEPPMNGAFFNPPAELTIAQTAEVVTMFVKDGAITEIHADGRLVHHGQASNSARWTKDGLVVEVQPGRGARRTETFSVSKDGRELTETLTLESRWGLVTVRRVYDAVSP